MPRTVSQQMDKADSSRCGSHSRGGNRHLAAAHWHQQLRRRTRGSRLRQLRQLDCRLCHALGLPACLRLRQGHCPFALNTHWLDCRLRRGSLHGHGQLRCLARRACHLTPSHSSLHPRVSSRCHSRHSLRLSRFCYGNHWRHVGNMLRRTWPRGAEEGDGSIGGLRWFRQFRSGTVWLHAHHLVLAERRTCRPH